MKRSAEAAAAARDDQLSMLTLARASAAATYGTMAPDVLDKAYDNGMACKHMLAEWKAANLPVSQAERANAPPEMLDLQYGSHKDERLDFLPAHSGTAADTTAAPTLLYIHGGYWHMNSPKETLAFVGAALRKLGVNVALAEYSGLPSPEPAPIGVQCQQVLAATEFVASKLASKELPGDPSKLVVAGHSAGGQLASLCALHPHTRAKVAGALAISMISDLEPLRRHSYFNLTLKAAGRPLISEEDVAEWSPLALVPPADAKEALPPIVAAVGGDELPELLHQTADFHTACAAQGHGNVTHLVVPGTNHFDVLDGLAGRQGGGAALLVHACKLLGVPPPPPPLKHIDKLALVYVRERKLLVARSKGKDTCYAPGGKREKGESDVQTLVREIKEELSVDLKVESIRPYGVFQAQAHGKPEGTMVIMTCYAAEFEGDLAAANEIEELRWIGASEAACVSATSALIVQDLAKKGLID